MLLMNLTAGYLTDKARRCSLIMEQSGILQPTYTYSLSIIVNFNLEERTGQTLVCKDEEPPRLLLRLC